MADMVQKSKLVTDKLIPFIEAKKSAATGVHTGLQWLNNIAVGVAKALSGDYAALVMAGAAALIIGGLALATNTKAQEENNAAV
jgi:hypothetical protein